jgi:hypothetical protein
MQRRPITFEDVFASPELAARLRSPATELLQGELVRQPLPSVAVVRTVVRLAANLDAQACGLRVGVREAVAAPPCDLLRPEVSLARPGVPAFVRPAPPATGLVLAVLVMERAVETPARLRRCAAAGIPETWVVTLDEDIGAAYGDPAGGRYHRREPLLPGEACAPTAAPWLRLVVIPARAEAGAGAAARALTPAPARSRTPRPPR